MKYVPWIIVLYNPNTRRHQQESFAVWLEDRLQRRALLTLNTKLAFLGKWTPYLQEFMSKSFNVRSQSDNLLRIVVKTGVCTNAREAYISIKARKPELS